MDRCWFKAGRNIYDDSWRNIYWSFSYDSSRLASTTSIQRRTQYLQNVLIRIVWNIYCLQLWHLFKYAELTEAARQNDKVFVNLLNKVRIGNMMICWQVTQGKIYTWIWWKLSKTIFAHVCREWICYEKELCCFKWFTWWALHNTGSWQNCRQMQIPIGNNLSCSECKTNKHRRLSKLA